MQINKQASFEKIICLSCLKQGKLQDKFKIDTVTIIQDEIQYSNLKSSHEVLSLQG